MVSELTLEEDNVQLRELGISSLWIFLHIFFSKIKVEQLSSLGRIFLSKQNPILRFFSFGSDTGAGN